MFQTGLQKNDMEDERKGFISRIGFFALMIFYIIYFFTSCTPQQRLSRLLKNHPELAKTDTTKGKVTFDVKGSQSHANVDNGRNMKDTLFLKNGNCVSKYFYYNGQSYIGNQQKDTTYEKEVAVAVTNVSPENGKEPDLKSEIKDYFLYGIILFNSIVLLIVVLRSRNKN